MHIYNIKCIYHHMAIAADTAVTKNNLVNYDTFLYG